MLANFVRESIEFIDTPKCTRILKRMPPGHASGLSETYTSTLTIEQHFGSSGPLGNVHRFTFEILNFLNFRNFLTWRFFRSSKLLSYKSAKRFEDTCRCRSIFDSKHWVVLSEYWGESALTVDLFSSQYLEGSWPAFWECHSCKDVESQRNLKFKIYLSKTK